MCICRVDPLVSALWYIFIYRLSALHFYDYLAVGEGVSHLAAIDAYDLDADDELRARRVCVLLP